nr:hypothetical protein CFP56_46786 [Quercus suber]
MATFNSSDKTNPAFYKPSESALLLLDFHTLFVQKAGGPRAAAALQVAADMRRWAQANGVSVLHALIDTAATPYETCKGSERLGGIINAMKGADEAEPEELLGEGGANELTFRRTPGYVSALKSPGMLEWLHEKGIKSLILTGLSTSGCVLRTTVPATDAELILPERLRGDFAQLDIACKSQWEQSDHDRTFEKANIWG